MKIDEKERDQEWEKQKKTLEKILDVGFSAFLTELPIDKSFRLADRSLRCVDEGTPGGLHLAGSGILLGVDEAAEIVKEAQIDGIFSHAGCGAAAVYVEKNSINNKKPDDVGEDFAKKLAAKAGLPYLGHVGLMELARPVTFHNAVCLYYDGTGRFDYRQAGLPSGFTISRKYLDKNYAQEEARITLDIAQGEHGFGKRFEKKTPFIMIAISGSNGDSASSLSLELEEVAKGRDSILIERLESPI